MPSATRSPPSGLRSTSYRCAQIGYVARCGRQARRAHWKLRLKPLTEGIVGSGKLQGCLRFRPSGCKALNSRTCCTPPRGTTTQSTSGSHSRLTLLFDEDLLLSVHAGHRRAHWLLGLAQPVACAADRSCMEASPAAWQRAGAATIYLCVGC